MDGLDLEPSGLESPDRGALGASGALASRLWERATKRPEWVVLALVAVLISTMGTQGLWAPWETEFADRVIRAVERGSWAVPRGYGALGFWLARASVSLLGVSEMALRLPGLLSGLLLAWLMVRVAREVFGGQVALVAGVILASSSHFLMEAGTLLGNMPLVASQGLVMLTLLRMARGMPHTWPWRLGLALGALATAAAGGWGAVALPAMVQGVVSLQTGRSRGLALTLSGLTLAFGAASLAPGLAFLGVDWIGGHGGTFEQILFQVVYGMFPWSILLPAALVVSSVWAGESDPARVFVVAWFGMAVALCHILARAGGVPLFSAFPAMALVVAGLSRARVWSGEAERRLFLVTFLLLAWVGVTGLARARDGWLHGLLPGSMSNLPVIRFPVWLVAGVFIWIAVVALYAARPSGWRVPWPWLARLARGLARFEEPSVATRVAVAAGLVVAAGLSWGLVPRLTAHLSTETVASTYEELAGPDDPLYAYTSTSAARDFYLRDIPRIAGRSEFLSRMVGDRPTFVIIDRDRLGELDSAFRGRTGRHLVVLDDRSSRLLLVSNHLPEGAKDLNPIPGMVLPAVPESITPIHALMGDGKLELAGVELSSHRVRLGGRLVITTYFEVLKPLSRDWKVFVHMETPRFRIDTRHTDHMPARGILSTRRWRVGDVVVDRFVLDVPLFSPIGEYTIKTGLFIGGERMKVDDPSKHDGQNRIELGRVVVRPL